MCFASKNVLINSFLKSCINLGACSGSCVLFITKIYNDAKYEIWLMVLCIKLQVNTHLTPRPILLTRHGESRDNVRGRIGGDSAIRFFYLWNVNTLSTFL